MLESTAKNVVYCAEERLLQCPVACVVLIEFISVGLVCLAGVADLILGRIVWINGYWVRIDRNDKWYCG